jgi:hypothetical protein
VNEICGLRLALSVYPELYEFSGDAVLDLVERGLYGKANKACQAAAPTLPAQQ